MFKHQDLQMFGFKLLQVRVIFTYLKLWLAVARQMKKEINGVLGHLCAHSKFYPWRSEAEHSLSQNLLKILHLYE